MSIIQCQNAPAKAPHSAPPNSTQRLSNMPSTMGAPVTPAHTPHPSPTDYAHSSPITPYVPRTSRSHADPTRSLHTAKANCVHSSFTYHNESNMIKYKTAPSQASKCIVSQRNPAPALQNYSMVPVYPASVVASPPAFPKMMRTVKGLIHPSILYFIL